MNVGNIYLYFILNSYGVRYFGGVHFYQEITPNGVRNFFSRRLNSSRGAKYWEKDKTKENCTPLGVLYFLIYGRFYNNICVERFFSLFLKLTPMRYLSGHIVIEWFSFNHYIIHLFIHLSEYFVMQFLYNFKMNFST